MFKHIKHIHLVGIGGIGMSGIAELLINMGYDVTGSDLRETKITGRLKELGAKITNYHKKGNVGGKDLVIYSSAIREDNPELIEANSINIPCIPRAEILGELMRMKEGIAVAGTHGKTTTTSMIAKILDKASLDPTLLIGGRLRGFGINARLGSGNYLVCEADESDRGFLKLYPVLSVITSIDDDHLNGYKDISEICDAFAKFANNVPFYGCVILCSDDENIQSILPRIKKRYVTYGLSSKAHITGLDIEMEKAQSFTVKSNNDNFGRFSLKLPGIHNIYNALAAIGIGVELEIDVELIREAIGEFEGVERRFELKGEIDGIKVIDDYAQHPKEVEVVLSTARAVHKGRILAIFEPHLFSRTLKLKDKFGRAFHNADSLIVTKVYPAREEPIEGVTGELIVKACKQQGHGDVKYIENRDEIVNYVVRIAKGGDLIMTIGAGSVDKVGEEILEALRHKN